jgi:GNAT superfamily N-acetyltransferase
VRPALHLGPLDASHRERVAEILRACRLFREDEVGVALELFDEAVREAGGGRRDDGLPVPDSRLPRPDYFFLGAFEEESPIGFACWGPTPGTDRTYDLYWIAVDPAWQGGGGGTTLLAEVERELAGAGARMLVVETSSRPEYVATRAFYERRGYTEAARLRAFYAPGDDRVVFTKRLPARAAGTER